MNNKIYYIIVATLFALALLSGCKSLTPMEATMSAGDETRLLISEHVTDEARAKQMITLIDQLEKDLIAYAEIQAAHNEKIRMKNEDYDALREDMQNLYDAYNSDTLDIIMKTAQTHLGMAKLATPEEWAMISKLEHRIGGF